MTNKDEPPLFEGHHKLAMICGAAMALLLWIGCWLLHRPALPILLIWVLLVGAYLIFQVVYRFILLNWLHQTELREQQLARMTMEKQERERDQAALRFLHRRGDPDGASRIGIIEHKEPGTKG